MSYLDLTLPQRLAAKHAEVNHYIGVLDRYGSGRWADMGRRNLAALRAEERHLREAWQLAQDAMRLDDDGAPVPLSE